MRKPRVKICCISSCEEASMAVEYGADALGLVSAMPSGPGVIDEATIAKIAAKVPPPIATFLLTSKLDAASIVDQQKLCGTNTIQLCDSIAPDNFSILRDKLPGIKLVQVIHVLNESSIREAINASEYADAILLDSGNPNLPVKQFGGTGNQHDWSLSRRIREAIDIPLFLAGGLKPDNICEAIETVQPYGVDLCSGVRTENRLDPVKLSQFFENISKISSASSN